MKINANWVVIKVPVTGEGFNVFNPAPFLGELVTDERNLKDMMKECQPSSVLRAATSLHYVF